MKIEIDTNDIIRVQAQQSIPGMTYNNEYLDSKLLTESVERHCAEGLVNEVKSHSLYTEMKEEQPDGGLTVRQYFYVINPSALDKIFKEKSNGKVSG